MNTKENIKKLKEVLQLQKDLKEQIKELKRKIESLKDRLEYETGLKQAYKDFWLETKDIIKK